jgi:hypothetical protein
MDCEDEPVARIVTIIDEQCQSCASAEGIRAPNAASLRDQAVAEVKAHKAAIQSALKLEAVWDRDDYRAFYDKVTGTLLSEGLPKPRADAFALECCVIEWLNRTFEPSPPGRCVHCGRGERNGEALLSLGMQSAGRAWLHKGCRDVWHANRRVKAFAALADLGISRPGRPTAAEEITATSSGIQQPKPADG